MTVTINASTSSGLITTADTSGVLALQTAGTTALTIDASQIIGVGTTPSAWGRKAIQIADASSGYFVSNTRSVLGVNLYNSVTNYYIQTGYAAYFEADSTSGSFKWFNAGSGTAGNAISFTQAMTLGSNGFLGIGNTSPVYPLDISTGANSAQIAFQSTISSGTNFKIAQGITGISNGGMQIYDLTNSVIRMAITSGGDFLINNGNTLGTAAAGSTHINGGANDPNQAPLYLRNQFSTAGRYWRVGPTNNAGFIIFNDAGTGQYMTYGATSWTATSDERLKTNLLPIQNAVQKVSTLRAVTGRYKTDEEGVSRSFLIAQDVQAVLPEAVDVQDDEIQTLGLRYTETIPLLVAAIKEQQAIIESLTQRITALEGAQP